jgi:ribonuclease D
MVRSLWEARDSLARRRDVAPGRILPDAAIVTAALADPRTSQQLAEIPPFNGQRTRRHLAYWWDALAVARDLDESRLPRQSQPNDAPPPARAWADRDPEAAARLAAARAAVAAIADEHGLPVENLLSPDAVRRLCWQPPDDLSPDAVTEVLAGYGARRWQIGLTAGPLSKALVRLRDHPRERARERPRERPREPSRDRTT